MSFGISENPWNSVDVRGDDGLLHHGRVIEAAPLGLVVDFGGTKEPGAKLIPFGRIYDCKNVSNLEEILLGAELSKLTEHRPIEVLLRAKPEAPWKWYPGTLLVGEPITGAFGLVSVTLPDGVMQGIVDGPRIRARSTSKNLANRRVKKDTFSSQLVVVPRKHSEILAPDDELVDCVNAKFHGSDFIMATRVVTNEHRKFFKELVILSLFDKPGQPRPYATKRGWKFCGELLLPKMDSNGTALENIRYLFPKISPPDGRINGLCGIILAEVFEYMTTVEQNILRGICRQWEPLLFSARCGRVSLSSQPGRDGSVISYTNAACLYNCIQPHTTMLIFRDRVVDQLFDGRPVGTARLLKCMMDERGVPKLRTVLLVDTMWYTLADRGDWSEVLYGELTALKLVCQETVLKKVQVNLQLMGPERAEWALAVRIADQRIDSQFTMDDVWTMLNTGLADLEPVDVECLAQWIRHVSTNPTTDLWIVAEVLHMTQTSDPRDGIAYCGMEFYPHGTDLLDQVDAYRLSNLTLHVLWQHFKKRGVKTVIVNM